MSTLTEAADRTASQWRAVADELTVAITETTDEATLAELRAARLHALAESDRCYLRECAR